MALFDDITQFQESVRVNNDFQDDSVLMHVTESRKYIEPWLGVALTDLCFDQDGSSTEAVKALLPYLRACVGPFTMVEAAPVIDLGISNNGFVVTLSSNQAPASRERVAAFINQMMVTAYDALERMLEFLFANVDDYSGWSNSDAYTRYAEHLFRTSAQLNKYIDVPISARVFFEAHAKFEEVEENYIAGYISATQLAQIVSEVIADNLAEANETILPWLRRGLANMFAAELSEGAKSQKLINTAENYMTKAIKAMDAAPTSYALYAASDCYTATRTTYEKFTNEQTNSIYVMGQ